MTTNHYTLSAKLSDRLDDAWYETYRDVAREHGPAAADNAIRELVRWYQVVPVARPQDLRAWRERYLMDED